MNRNDNTRAMHSLRGQGRALRADITGALRGMEYDFTSGSIGRAILLLSIPMVMEMLMESVFALADIFFVSRLGPEAIATVGITESLLTVVYAISMGLSLATTAIVARRTGEKNRESAAEAAVQSILVGCLVSVPLAGIGLLFARRLLTLMGMPAALVETLWPYTAIMLGSNLVIMLLFIINAVFRGAGDAAIAMRVLWTSNLINIALDPLLIFGIGPFPELGLAGAALATGIGRGLGVLFQFVQLTRKQRRIQVTRRHWQVDFPVIRQLIRLSLGGMGQYLIATASWILLMRIMAQFGSDALAGYTIAVRLIMFSLLPSWGMSNAASTLMGQNLGAGQPDRAARSVRISALVNMAFLTLIGIALYGTAEWGVRLFTGDPAVVEIGMQCLRIISLGYVFYALGMVMGQAFNGAGDTWTPTVLNFICFWLLELPLAYVLALPLGAGVSGVFLAILIAESLLGLLGFLVFRRGTWRTRVV